MSKSPAVIAEQKMSPREAEMYAMLRQVSSPLKKGLFVGAHSRGRNVAAKPN